MAGSGVQKLTITKKDGKQSTRWRARFHNPDTRQIVSKYFDRQADAKAWVKAQQSDYERGESADARKGRMTFHAFALKYAAGKDWSPVHHDLFPRDLRRLETVLPKNVTLAQIKRATVKETRRKLDKKYSAATVRLTFGYLKAIMRDAKDNEYIKTDPTAGMKGPRVARRADADRRDAVPTRAQVLALIEAAPAQYRAAVALGASGLRISEVVPLTADRVAIDADNVRVTIDRQLQRIPNPEHAEARTADGVAPEPVGRDARRLFLVPTKNGQSRTIKIPVEFAGHVRNAKRDRIGGALLFTTSSGQPMMRQDAYKLFWHPALRGAGFAADAFVWHSLRHHCVSVMLDAGAPVPAVAAHIGDTPEVMLRTYTHNLNDNRDLAADALDRAYAQDREARSAGNL